MPNKHLCTFVLIIQVYGSRDAGGRLQGRIHAVLNNKDKGMQVRLRDPK
ncbi:MAG: hypothetical protein GY751_21120 [Bacteroidetes bacterium]|nr:hypothetical protein [Bacteroidota bacterium]